MEDKLKVPIERVGMLVHKVKCWYGYTYLSDRAKFREFKNDSQNDYST